MASNIEQTKHCLTRLSFYLLVAVLLLGNAAATLADVNPDGSFSHAIPIRMPSGINGVQPDLEISYRSDSGNGMLGMGFQLSGLPVITRMNYGEGINYDAGDTYASREGRLVAIGGNTYRAETDRATVYEVLSSGPQGPEAWVAKDRHGNRWYYGNSTSSRIEAVGRDGVRTWALNKFEDKHGNYYEITYTTDAVGGDYYPLLIRYTKNDLAGSSDFSIEFATEARSDAPVSYQHSARVVMDQRLSKITVKAGTQVLSVYDLVYEEDTLTRQSKLSSLILTAGTVNPIVKTTVFTWQDQAVSTGSFANATSFESPLDWGLTFPNTWLQGDFNGDGLSDFMYLTPNEQWVTKFANVAGSFDTVTTSSASVLHGSSLLDWGQNMPYTWLKGDFNGDGRIDFMFLDAAAVPTWHIHVSNGDGTFAAWTTITQAALTPNVLDWGRTFPNSWQVGDFNGDRLTDFMYLDTAGNWNLQLADGQGGFLAQTPQPRTTLTSNILDWGGSFRNSWLKGDFNGDGKQDFMYLDTANDWQVRLSQGNGQFAIVNAGKLTENASQQGDVLDWGSSFPNAWLQGDFNGDGKQDFMYLDMAGAWQQLLSIGNGQFAKSASTLNTATLMDWGSSFPNTWLVADLNGDGRTDLRYLDANSHWQTRLSNGDATFTTIPGDTLGPDVATVLGWGNSFPNAWQLGDFTGSGKIDVLHYGSNGLWTNTFSHRAASLLTNITTSEFGTISIDYASVFEFANAIHDDVNASSQTCGQATGYGYRQPCGIPDATPRFLVKEVRTADGRSVTGGTIANQDVDSIHRYDYQNGRRLPGSAREAQFLGFETVTERHYVFSADTEVHLSTLETNYRQDGLIDFGDGNGYVKSPFSGFPAVKTKTYRQNSVAALGDRIEYAYNDDKVHLYPVMGTTEVTQVLLRKRLTTNYQGGQLSSRQIEMFEFDSYGRETAGKSCIVDGVSASTASSLTDCDASEIEATDTTYAAWSIGSTWKAENVTAVTESLGNTTVEQIEHTYNPGHLLRSTKFNLFCEVVEECSGSGWVTTQNNLTYNDHGLIQTREEANNSYLTLVYDAANPGLVAEKTFTDASTNNTFSETFTYYTDGSVQEQRNVNNLPTTFEYDGLGRITKKTNAAGGVTTYQYSDGDPNENLHFMKASFTMQSDPDGQTTTSNQFKFLDSHRFVYKTETTASDNPSTSTIVENVKRYSGEKLVTKTSRPYFSQTPPESIVWDQTTYDSFGRKERIDMPDGSYIRYEYDLNEVRKIENHEDESGTVSDAVVRSVYDKKLRLSKIYDQDNHLTTYAYNSVNRISQVELPVDEHGVAQTIHIKYDSFGRRTSITDPSMGKTLFKYDTSGNLIEQTDHQGRKKIFTYDGLKRPISKTVNDGTSDTISISYFYDTIEIGDALTNFPKGKISKIVDQTGTHLFAYDTLENVTTKIRDITGLGTGYTETFHYNQAGKLLQYTFPDGSVQKVSYNGMGSHQAVSLLSSANDVLASGSFSNFNAAQQMQRKELGNSVMSNYAYTANGYLETMQTCKTDGAGNCIPPIIQDLSYQFFNYGMIKNITDNRSGSMVKDGYNTDATQNFVYDKIGRLVKSFWGTKTDPSEIIEYEYNSIGNQIKRTSTVYGTGGMEVSLVDYVYSGQQVIAGYSSDVEHTPENQVFSGDYDAYGSMNHKVSRDASGNEVAWDYIYDDENRLIRVYKNAVGALSSNTPVTEFTYDHKGQRVKKRYNKEDGSTVTTWYISPTYEIRETSAGSMTSTKYLALKGKGKISSVTAEYTSAQAAVFNSQRYYRFAGTISADGLNEWVDKAYLYYMSFAVHPKSGSLVRNVIQLVFILVFLGLVCFSWRKREKQRASSMKTWQRLTALPLVLVFFLASCQSGLQSSDQNLSKGEYRYLTDFGELITGGMLNISGTTVDGIPIGVYYYHVDHLGSSTVITDQWGTEITRFIYNPFGELVQKRSWGQNVVTHKFTSQELDEETGLLYYNSRFYDPSINRFLTADILVPEMDNAQAYNRYSYVINNPIRFVDPTGHSWLSDQFKKIKKAFKKAVDKLIHEVSTAATEAYHTTQYNFVHCKPLRMAGGFLAAKYGNAPGSAAYAAWIAKSEGKSDREAFKIAIIAGATNYISNQIGEMIDGMDAGNIKVLARGILNGAASKAEGGAFETGFVLGAGSEFTGWDIEFFKGYINPKYKPASAKPPGMKVSDPTRNNVGLSNDLSLWSEGGPLSRATNKMPGMNNMAVFHDVWAGRREMGPKSTIVSIVPALPATYLALGHRSLEHKDNLKSDLY